MISTNRCIFIVYLPFITKSNLLSFFMFFINLVFSPWNDFSLSFFIIDLWLFIFFTHRYLVRAIHKIGSCLMQIALLIWWWHDSLSRNIRRNTSLYRFKLWLCQGWTDRIKWRSTILLSKRSSCSFIGIGVGVPCCIVWLEAISIHQLIYSNCYNTKYDSKVLFINHTIVMFTILWNPLSSIFTSTFRYWKRSYLFSLIKAL